MGKLNVLGKDKDKSIYFHDEIKSRLNLRNTCYYLRNDSVLQSRCKEVDTPLDQSKNSPFD